MIIGHHEGDWVEAEQYARFKAHDARAIQGEVLEADEPFTSPDGKSRIYRSRKAPLRFSCGEVIGVVVVSVDVTERRHAEEREQLLMREVDHRAKNMLAVVQSVVALTRGEDMDSFKDAAQGRIHSLARAHSLLSAARWNGVDLKRLADEEMEPFLRGGASVTVSGPSIRLKPAAAQSIALALHELATNAAKYGALSAGLGSVDLSWEATNHDDGRTVEIVWLERGGPPVGAPPKHSGFGSNDIWSTIERQLGGTLALDWQPDGLAVKIVLTAPQIAEDGQDITPRPAPVVLAPAGSASGKRVLIVEDLALIAMQIEEVLIGLGCEGDRTGRDACRGVTPYRRGAPRRRRARSQPRRRDERGGCDRACPHRCAVRVLHGL